MRYKNNLIILVSVVSLGLLATLGFLFIPKTFSVHATSTSNFSAGRIIDDKVFYNKDAMTVQQIQSFLDKQIPNCDVWGTQPAQDKKRGDITRAQYASLVGWASPPYVCLNKYYENPLTNETSFEKGGGSFAGGISAAQIIYNAAQKYGISPQVLLVLLKKESAGPLTADSWPLKSQYKYAMGYACPDSGPNYSASCTESKSGFYKQVNLAAWQLKYYKENSNDYRYKIGWNDIQYSPNPACGTKRIYIENLATLSLYIYTPYTPNNASLSNYPGEATCGSYGNRNFFMFFSEWFGDPSLTPYSWEGMSGTYYTDSTKRTVVDSQNLPRSQYVFVSLRFKNTGGATWRKGDIKLGTKGDISSRLCTYAWLSCNRIATTQEVEVKPGEVGTFETWILTPDTPGQHRQYYGALIEGVTWLDDIGSSLGIKVGGKRGDSQDSITEALKNTLNIGEHLLSPNKRVSLYLNHRGSLVLYRDGQAVWSTPGGGSFLVLQGDGNLVLYSKAGRVIWVTGAIGAASLKISNEGQLHLMNSSNNILWSTPPSEKNTQTSDSLNKDSVLFTDQSINSINQTSTLIVQGDGNLVVYRKGKALWAANSIGGSFLIQQSDGNLVLYDFGGSPVWSSNRSGEGVVTYIQDDGNLVSYYNRGVLWAAR